MNCDIQTHKDGFLILIFVYILILSQREKKTWRKNCQIENSKILKMDKSTTKPQNGS